MATNVRPSAPLHGAHFTKFTGGIYWIVDDTPLTIGVIPCVIRFGDTITQVALQTIVIPNPAVSSTNYVEINSAGTLSSNLTAFTAGAYPLMSIVAAHGTIGSQYTSHTDAGGILYVQNAAGGGVPAAASEPFVTIGNSANLSAERALTAGNGVGFTDGGANGAVTLKLVDLTADWTNAGVFDISHAGNLTVLKHAAIGPGASIITTRTLNIIDAGLANANAKGIYVAVTNATSGVGVAAGLHFIYQHNASALTQLIAGGVYGIVTQQGSGAISTMAGATVGGSSTGAGAIATWAAFNTVAASWLSAVPTATYVLLGTEQGGAGVGTAYGLYVPAQTGTAKRSFIADSLVLGGADRAALAILDSSTVTTTGWLPPNLTTTQRNAIGSPATSLLIFNTTTGQYEFYNGAAWAAVGGSGSLTDHTHTATGSGSNGGGATLQPGAFLLSVPTDLTIAVGVITVTLNHHRVLTEAAAVTDDLDTINGFASNGTLTLQLGSDLQQVVIKHGTGNILCVGGDDIKLRNYQDTVQLYYDAAQALWFCLPANSPSLLSEGTDYATANVAASGFFVTALADTVFASDQQRNTAYRMLNIGGTGTNTITSGIVTLNKQSSTLLLTGESVLNGITVAAGAVTGAAPREGDLIAVCNRNTYPITLRHDSLQAIASERLFLTDSVDVVLDTAYKVVWFIYDSSLDSASGGWKEATRSFASAALTTLQTTVTNLEAEQVDYFPDDTGNWDDEPETVAEGLDLLAQRTSDLEDAGTYAPRTFVWSPDAAPAAVITAGNQQGNLYNSGPDGCIVENIIVHAETAPGALGLPITIQYGDSQLLQNVVNWTTIVTYTLSSVQSGTSAVAASVPANRIMRMNVGTIVGSPADVTISLEAKSPLRK